MIDARFRRKDQPVALLRQPKAEFLVFAGGSHKDRIETAVLQEDGTAIRRRVGVDKVDLLGAAHAIVAVLVLSLYEARDDAALFGYIGALSAR